LIVWQRWLVALGSGVFGTVLVLSVILWMNQQAALERKRAKHTTAFEVAPPPPPKPKPKPKPRKRKKSVRKSARLAPLPDLGLGLSGIDLDLGLDVEDFGQEEDLLGDQTVVEESVDTPPQPLTSVRFVYPPQARQEGIEGYVVLSILVNERGEVVDAQVLESVPSGVFDQSALEGIRRLRFSPARSKGQPVKAWVRQKIVFQLG